MLEAPLVSSLSSSPARTPSAWMASETIWAQAPPGKRCTSRPAMITQAVA